MLTRPLVPFGLERLATAKPLLPYLLTIMDEHRAIAEAIADRDEDRAAAADGEPLRHRSGRARRSSGSVKIGVRVPCYRRWCRAPQIRAIAAAAEELGFASLWVQDHLVAPTGPREEVLVEGISDWMSGPGLDLHQGHGPAPGRRARRRPTTVQEYYAGDDWWLEPYVTWGYLAALTTRVQLASDIVVVPYRNPLVQAKMLGTLDVLSGGRMILGTGSGHVAAESQALGIDFAARGRMHDEYLRVIRQLLSQEEVTFEGEFFTFGPLRP